MIRMDMILRQRLISMVSMDKPNNSPTLIASIPVRISPTSFDCSGFVSYVLTNSGLVNTGRLGAQGLYNICTPVSNPQPGDLVFFQGTYDTTGVSHVGIYVGDQVMLHCGDPIQYTSINTSYWRSHFFAYGRPPY